MMRTVEKSHHLIRGAEPIGPSTHALTYTGGACTPPSPPRIEARDNRLSVPPLTPTAASDRVRTRSNNLRVIPFLALTRRTISVSPILVIVNG